MKNKLYYCIALVLLLIVGCKDNLVEMPNIEVSLSDTTFNAGKEVIFNLSGNPDIINFYSGEIGKRYEYAERDSATGTPILQFTSLRMNGSQSGSLQLMVSSDFSGITVGMLNDTVVDRINRSTWDDITNRAVYSTGTNTASGNVELTDYAQAEKPVYIAFRYLALEGSTQNKWIISGLTLKNSLADGTSYTLANTTNTVIANYGASTIYSPGWVFYKISNNYSWSLSSNNLTITGATSAATATASAESWAIMGPINLKKVSRDVGAPIKGLDTRLPSYSYTYTTAGVYTATFVAKTENVYGKKETIKQVQVKVKP